jgi:hypothetical protein
LGRKYGRGKYGAKTYDLGPNVCPIEPWLPGTIPEEIWTPIPLVPTEVWGPETALPPGLWEPTVFAPVEVWGASSEKEKTWVAEVDKTPIYQNECNG